MLEFKDMFDNVFENSADLFSKFSQGPIKRKVPALKIASLVQSLIPIPVLTTFTRVPSKV